MSNEINKGPIRRRRGPCRFAAACAIPFIIISAAAQENDEGTEPSAWSGSVSLRALSRLTQYGIDAAPERVTMVAGGSLAHEGGFSVSVSAAVQPDPWTAQRTSIAAAYELSVDDAWSLTFSAARSWYPAGSTNPLANSPTSGSIAASYDIGVWSFGADLDRYFGGDGATYASLDASAFIDGGSFSVIPLVSCSFGSQTVTSSSLKRSKGRSTTLSTTATVTGLSSIDGMVVVIVPLGAGWSASMLPGVIFTPSDLATSNTRFTWSVGIRKAL